MKLEILKSEVFKEVEKRSSLEAAGQPEAFEQLWASKYEGGFLDTYWIEACSMAVQLLKRYLRNQTKVRQLDIHVENEQLCIVADMPDRFDRLLEGSIEMDLKLLIAAHVLSGWFGVKAPDRAEKYAAEVSSHAELLKAKLLYRMPPLRNSIRKGNDQFILPSYEECDHCIEPGGDYGRCDKCGPCHRT